MKVKVNPENAIVVPCNLDDVPSQYVGRMTAGFSCTVQLEEYGPYYRSEFRLDIPIDVRRPVTDPARRVGNLVIKRCLDQLNAGIGAVDDATESKTSK